MENKLIIYRIEDYKREDQGKGISEYTGEPVIVKFPGVESSVDSNVDNYVGNSNVQDNVQPIWGSTEFLNGYEDQVNQDLEEKKERA